MIFADALPYISVLVPVLAAMVTGFFAVLVARSGRHREVRISELYERFEERAQLVVALRESRDQWQDRAEEAERDNDFLTRENRLLRRRLRERDK